MSAAMRLDRAGDGFAIDADDLGALLELPVVLRLVEPLVTALRGRRGGGLRAPRLGGRRLLHRPVGGAGGQSQQRCRCHHGDP